VVMHLFGLSIQAVLSKESTQDGEDATAATLTSMSKKKTALLSPEGTSAAPMLLLWWPTGDLKCEYFEIEGMNKYISLDMS